MLLSLTTTYNPATDLGYLLHKNPARVQSFPLSMGKAHIYYPEATEDRCTAVLLLDIDPIGLIRGRERTLADQYVNDRPYVASSFLSVAISEVFGSALNGRCQQRSELVEMRLPLTARIASLSVRGGERLLRKLFEPLGYEIKISHHPLDEQFPEWGPSRYYTLELSAHCRLHELLSHLYVLIPVLDDEKHYWVGDDEVQKLLRHGEGWLDTHPERELITKRYLLHQRELVRNAMSQLLPEEAAVEEEGAANEETLESRISLNEQRHEAVVKALKESRAQRVLDLGCGEGKLLRRLIEEPQFREVVGVDVSIRALEIADKRMQRLKFIDPERIVRLMQGSLMYRDSRLAGYDAAALVEVIEHLDPPRLSMCERVAFEFARPRVVVVTTPNAEYNVKFEGLPAGQFRHRDHRFEWTRAEFQAWCERIALTHGYRVDYAGIGEPDPSVGTATQMATFTWRNS
jgi:3' terminal RNA ribose 2'-O-methyltransferase Hen1